MQIYRSARYLLRLFSKVRSVFGFKKAGAFIFAYIRNKIRPLDKKKGGGIAYIPIGPYQFYFLSLDSFMGLFTEIFLKETYYFATTNEPIRVIDCGANIGMSLFYIKIRAPQAQVMCFEPNPFARMVLEKNVTANKWEKDVHVYPYALGKNKEKVNFFVDHTKANDVAGSTTNLLFNHRENTSYTVDMDTLSSYINTNIDFLKMDIEGAEFDVLEEMIGQNKLRYIKELQLEYHYFPGSLTKPLSELLALLESEGFRTLAAPNRLPHHMIDHDIWHSYMVFAWRYNPTVDQA